MSDLKQTDQNGIKHNAGGFIPGEILETIPEKDREKFITVVQEIMFASFVKNNNSLTDKLTPDHITNIINNSDAHDRRDRDERKGQRYYHLLIFIISLIFLGFVIVFLKDDKDLLYKIIIALISFLGGFGIGKSGIIKM